MSPDIDERAYALGFEDAQDAYEHDQPTGDPVGVCEDYELGWWCGVGHCMAWHEGYSAAKRGMLFCPYATGADDDCFRDPWMSGYLAAFEIDPNIGAVTA